jgi:hypothetical protein
LSFKNLLIFSCISLSQNSAPPSFPPSPNTFNKLMMIEWDVLYSTSKNAKHTHKLCYFQTIEVFWDVTCCWVNSCLHFKGTTVVWNVINYSFHDMVSHPRKLEHYCLHLYFLCVSAACFVLLHCPFITYCLHPQYGRNQSQYSAPDCSHQTYKIILCTAFISITLVHKICSLIQNVVSP